MVRLKSWATPDQGSQVWLRYKRLSIHASMNLAASCIRRSKLSSSGRGGLSTGTRTDAGGHRRRCLHPLQQDSSGAAPSAVSLVHRAVKRGRALCRTAPRRAWRRPVQGSSLLAWCSLPVGIGLPPGSRYWAGRQAMQEFDGRVARELRRWR